MQKKMIIAAIATSLILAGCSQEQVDKCMEAQNPQECMQVRDAGGDVSDYLLYGMAGYMLGSMMSGGKKVTYITTNPNYHGPRRSVSSYTNSYRTVSNPSYRPYSARKGINVAAMPTKRVVTTTTTTTKKSGLLGSKTTTTTRTTKSSSWGGSSRSSRPSSRRR